MTVCKDINRPYGVDLPGAVPSPQQVAVAVEVACRETGAKVEDVLSGKKARGAQFAECARARVYAALALRCLYENCRQARIAELVGCIGATKTFIGQVDYRMRHHNLKWWDDAVFMRVVEAIEASMP